MSTTRLHPHHSLPAPVVHATFSVPQSKSHVLAGVQDAYWSDDEAEDAECPLCLEEMDISDLNFKPCICGYQICRFCWHHIKENLNKRCPACRRVYTDDAVEFKPIATQDHKRLTQQKKQRDRERKDLEMLGRKHLANVRVVQRNVVYVVGIGPRFAKEELIPTLRSNEYFGQYGKITKIILVKRTSSGGGPVVGLYITYHRREDAARAIAAVDGTPSPGGGRDPMRASYGTTKYCMAFLRGVQCSDHSCMNLHEWGDEKDCFTKEDLTTLKHTMKATESRTRTITTKKADEDAGLPRAASWAQKGSTPTTPAVGSNTGISTGSNVPITTATTTPRQTRRTAPTRLPRNTVTTSTPSTETRASQVKTPAERKATAISASRPSTPAIAEGSRVEVASESKALKAKEVVSVPESTNSPAPSATTASDDVGSSFPEPPSTLPARPDSRPESTEPMRPNARPLSSKPSATFLAPPGLSAPPGLTAPPGLAAPPGISTPSRPPRAETTSPQTPLLASQSSYQISNTARALIDDFKARTVSALPASSAFSPFPDFDRTLQTLSGGDGGFSFNLDPKLADGVDSTENLSDFDSSIPFHGSYIDAFPALRTGSPYMQSSSLGYSHPNSHSIYDPSTLRVASASLHEKQTGKGTGYLGSFNPFSDTAPDNSAPSQRYPHSPVDDERKVSRFGFARGRQSSTATSSPLHSVTPLTYGNDLQGFFHSSEESMHSWPPGLHDIHVSNSHTSSPLAQQAQAQPAFGQQPRLQSLNGTGDLSEAQLRNFILSSQERENSARNMMDSQQNQFRLSQHFEDPAIMSASFAAPTSDHVFASMAYGPPPGLPVPQRLSPSPAMVHNGISMDDRISSTQVLPVILSTPPTFYSEDFPALAPSTSDTVPAASAAEPILAQEPSVVASSKSQEKAERKAAKKAAAAEKALERQRIAVEKAEVRAVEKAKIAKAKAAEKEKEKEREEQEKALLLTQLQVSTQLEAESPKSPVVVQAARPDKSRSAREESPVAKPGTPKKASSKPADTSAANKRREPSAKPNTPANPQPKTPISLVEVTTQVPLLSKKPKKNKPIAKPVYKAPAAAKEEDTHEEAGAPSATDPTRSGGVTAESTPVDSRSQSVDRYHTPTSVQELLEQIDAINPGMDLSEHPFFDVQKLTSPAKMPLEYGPLVHALSALSVGGGSFANNMPSGSIDNAVSSFQQLLETLTQTISDLLRLLPRTTWDDSSSFDGVLRDMLKGDDFLDDGEEGPGKDDEVAALTLALERRARWMEVQLSKLEELHRDINTAAVRAVLSFNDSGWDRHGFLPKIGNTLRRFDNIGVVADNGGTRAMNADELEKKLAVAKEAAIFAETEIREAMERFQIAKH